MSDFYIRPPTYSDVRSKVYELKHSYNEMRLFTIGKSVLGRKLYAMGIGNLKNATLFVGAIHAQEWLTCLVLFRFFEKLCSASKNKEMLLNGDINTILKQRGLIVIPYANPDGVEIALNGAESAKHLRSRVGEMLNRATRSWQANARGVDLNHNFDAGFAELKQMEKEAGIINPCERQYGGRMPHSEPETRSLVNICLSLNIKKLLAFHSQGEEIFYGYGKHTPKNAKLVAAALASCCGYKVIEPEGMASHGGLKDWFISSTHRYGFTVEIGKGENPLPVSDLDSIYQQIEEMMLMSILI